MSERSLAVVLLACSALVLALCVLILALLLPHDGAATIDCGPEGKPVLNGTACIDREPLFIEEGP